MAKIFPRGAEENHKKSATIVSLSAWTLNADLPTAYPEHSHFSPIVHFVVTSRFMKKCTLDQS